MDQDLELARSPRTFNGPLEAGIRAVTILGAAHPRTFDLQRMIAFDYLLVHTGDIGGPASLHPSAPLHSAELLIRRKLVEQALMMMMTRHLVERDIAPAGIAYRAGENAALFLDSLVSDYATELKQRAGWLVQALGDRSDSDFQGIMRKFFDRWVEEFQAAERSLGSEA